MRADAVEQRRPDHRPGRRGLRHDRRPGEPGQPLVTEPDDARSDPARALEPHRLGGIGPGADHRQQRGAEPPGSEQQPDRQRQRTHRERDPQPPAARHPPRGNRPVGLVDGVDMTVAPVIGCLAHAADDRPGEHDPEDRECPVSRERNARRDHAAEIGPHRWKPGDRLQQFQRRGGGGNRSGCKL